MDFNQITESKVETNEGSELKELVSLYKYICLEIVKVTEKTIYKSIGMTSHKNILNDFSSMNLMVSDFLFNIFKFIESGENNDGLLMLVEKLMEESDEKKLITMAKLFMVIESFYESIERESLDIDSLDNYLNNIIEQFNDYSLINTEYLIDIIKEDEIKDCTFRMEIEE